MKNLLDFLKKKKDSSKETVNLPDKKTSQIDEKDINMFKSAVSQAIFENDVDTEPIKKLIKNYNYDIDTIIYNLEFPSSWRNNKEGFSNLRSIVDGVNQIFNDDPKYKNIDWSDFWSYFQKNILDLLN